MRPALLTLTSILLAVASQRSGAGPADDGGRLRREGQAGGEAVAGAPVSVEYAVVSSGNRVTLYTHVGTVPLKVDSVKLDGTVQGLATSGSASNLQDFTVFATTDTTLYSIKVRVLRRGLELFIAGKIQFPLPFFIHPLAMLGPGLPGGDHAAVGLGPGATGGFALVDVSDAAHPTQVSEVTGIGGATDLVAWQPDASHTYLAAGTSTGFHLYDVTNPSAPVPLDEVPVGVGVSAVAVDDVRDRAVMVVSVGIIQFIDLSDPQNLSLIGTPVPRATQGLDFAFLNGTSTLFTADDSSGWSIWDIDDPASPMIVTSMPMIGIVSTIAETDGAVFVGNRDLGMFTYTVTAPDQVTPAAVYPGFNCRQAHLAEGRLFASTFSGGMQVFSMPPSGEGEMERLAAWPHISWSGDVVGTTIHSTQGPNGMLRTMDLGNPPAVLDEFDTRGLGYSVEVYDYGGPIGRVAFVADGTSLEALSVNDPANIGALGSFGVTTTGDLARHAVNVEVTALPSAPSQVLAFVACLGFGLKIVDATDPTALTQAGMFSATSVYDVEIADTTAYLADGLTGLRIVDVSDPAMPVELGLFNTPGRALGVTVSGEVAFVADQTSLLALDVSNPASVQLIHRWETTTAQSVDREGDFLAVADGRGGALVFTFGPDQPLDGDLGDLLLGIEGDDSGLDLNHDGAAGVADIVTVINEGL